MPAGWSREMRLRRSIGLPRSIAISPESPPPRSLPPHDERRTHRSHFVPGASGARPLMVGRLRSLTGLVRRYYKGVVGGTGSRVRQIGPRGGGKNTNAVAYGDGRGPHGAGVGHAGRWLLRLHAPGLTSTAEP